MRPCFFALCIAGLLFCIGCDRLPGKPTTADIELKPQEVRDFAALYRQNCSGCHGQEGKGNGAIAPDEILRHRTSLGVRRTMMPAFLKSAGGTLTEEQIEILVSGMRARWS